MAANNQVTILHAARIVPALLAILFLPLSLALAGDAHMGIVTGTPGKIMEGDKVLAEVPQGTRLWIFDKKAEWAEVKVPGQEQHGWMEAKSIQDAGPSPAQLEELKKGNVRFQEVSKSTTEYSVQKKELQTFLALCLQNFGNESPAYAELLVRAGVYARNKDDYQFAEQCLTQALAIQRKMLGNDVDHTAGTLVDLFINFSGTGDYAKARACIDEALKIARQLGGDESLDLAIYQANLGNLLMAQGDYVAAKKQLTEALGIYKKLGELETDYAATNRINLGDVAMEQGDYQAAREQYSEALKTYRILAKARDYQNLAFVLQQMGNLDRLEKNYANSKLLLQEAVDLHQKRFGEQHSTTASTLQSLGDLELNLQEYPAARKHFESALAVRKKVFGNEHYLVAETLQRLGDLAQQQQDYKTAWESYNAAWGILRRVFGNEHPKTMSILGKMSLLAVSEEEYDVAARHWDQFRRIQHRYAQYLLPFMSAEEQLKFLDNNYLPYWLSSLALGYQQRTDPTIINFSSNWLLNGKAVAQESLAARELLMRDFSNPTWGALAKELQTVRTQLASQSLAAVKPDQVAAQQAALTQLVAEEYRLSQKLSQVTGQSSIVREWVELGELRRHLQKDSLYIDFVRVPVADSRTTKEATNQAAVHYLAWVIPAHRNGTVSIIDLGNAAAIDLVLEQSRQSLAQALSPEGTLRNEGEATATAQAEQGLQVVAEMVLRPLLPYLADKKQLILSPDGALWLLPWAALPVEKNKRLLEQCSIRFVLSGRDLVKQESASKLATSAPAIFANPDFDLAGQAAKVALKAILPQTTFDENATHGIVSKSSLPQVRALPFTAFEGDSAKPILAKLAKSQPQSFQQDKALEAVVKNLKRPTHLLFATHGFFLPDQVVKQHDDKLQLASSDTRSLPTLTMDGKPVENPLLRCGLLFAGCNAPRISGIDDGILTGLEIVGMDLRGTELVVLSACETGIGKVRNGEGVAGLRQAFQLAGAEAVVSTLWQVPDRDSAIIMQDFFTNLAAGQSKADALRNAQLKRIAARKEKSGAAHPFFWAAWTVTGN